MSEKKFVAIALVSSILATVAFIASCGEVVLIAAFLTKVSGSIPAILLGVVAAVAQFLIVSVLLALGAEKLSQINVQY